jgi:hypothetical protein
MHFRNLSKKCGARMRDVHTYVASCQKNEIIASASIKTDGEIDDALFGHVATGTLQDAIVIIKSLYKYH